jgi:hypothetical protein
LFNHLLLCWKSIVFNLLFTSFYFKFLICFFVHLIDLIIYNLMNFLQTFFVLVCFVLFISADKLGTLCENLLELFLRQ